MLYFLRISDQSSHELDQSGRKFVQERVESCPMPRPPATPSHRPDIVGVRGSMDFPIRPCMASSTPRPSCVCNPLASSLIDVGAHKMLTSSPSF